MRLLNTTTLQVEYCGDGAQRYAVLSHRWVEEEVTFQDIENGSAKSKKGYKKLEDCCKLARNQGHDWVWIDTCCIDKSSSAELNEAINSMYAWYQRSSICYAYLDDVTGLDTLGASLWFTRGWTLQELLAPRNVLLLVPGDEPDRGWREIGTRAGLADSISSITSISRDVLLGHKSPLQCNIAQRMAWASERVTTRSEDVAYCLLGLFDIHMTPIYGEGREKAFLRLQREIMLHNSDQTIFLWTQSHDPYNQGLLATSPKAFCIHQECFLSKFETLSDTADLKLPEEVGSDPYSLFRARDFSRRENYMGSSLPKEIKERLEETQANVLSFPGALGAHGLHIPLLVSKEVKVPGDRIILARLDVDMAIDQMWRGDVLVGLVPDVTPERQDIAIPNGLGAWRRLTHAQSMSKLFVNFSDIDFERKVLTISQLSTSDTGAYSPVTFALQLSEGPLKNHQVFVLPGDGTAATPVPVEKHGGFTGVSGFITGHHCDKCQKEDSKILTGTTLIIGFGVRGPFHDPWCCAWACLPEQREDIFKQMGLLQRRFGWNMRRPMPGCRRLLDVRVFQDSGAEALADHPYIIRVQDADDD